jgi:hypothetical protein
MFLRPSRRPPPPSATTAIGASSSGQDGGTTAIGFLLRPRRRQASPPAMVASRSAPRLELTGGAPSLSHYRRKTRRRISRRGGRPAWGRSWLCRYGGPAAGGVSRGARQPTWGGPRREEPACHWRCGAAAVPAEVFSSSSFGSDPSFSFVHICRSVKRLGLPCESAVRASSYTRK